MMAVGASLVASPASAQAANDDATMVETIVVTARKRAENLQEVPVSVTALSGADLERRGVDNAAELQYTVPNLTLSATDDLNPNFIIRGINSGARNVGFESSLGLYVDGVFLGRTSAFTQGVTDIERIEVLRGPQGTLFGKNTTSGAINIVTQRPTESVAGKLFVEAGNYGIRKTEGDLRGPIIEDKLLGKVSFFTSERDGYLKNLRSSGQGPKRLDTEEVWGGRGELLWRASEETEVSLKGDYARNSQNLADGEILVGPGAVAGPRTVDVNRPNRERRTIGGVSLTATHDMDAGQELVWISAYRKLKYGFPSADLDDTPQDLLVTNYLDDLDQYSHEVRLQSSGDGPFTYVAGLYAFRQTGNSARRATFGSDTPFEGVFLGTRTRVKTTSYAAFVNAEYEISEAWSVSGGLRYTREEKTLRFTQDGIPSFGYVDLANVRDKLTDSDLSPTLTLNYKFSDEVFGYARASRGFKSGGWNADFVVAESSAAFRPADIRFGAESMMVYELGLKSILLDGRLRLNVAAFNQSYKDVQVTQFVGGLEGYRTTNAGKARSRGAEADFELVVVPGLTVDGGVGYADAKYTDFRNATDAGDDYTGVSLGGPKFTANVGVQYRHEIGDAGHLLARLDYSYRSAAPAAPDDVESRVPRFAVVDARIGFESRVGWEAYLFAANLLDNDYVINRGTSGDLDAFGLSQINEQYGPPRTYGVRLGYRF